jgi:ornithine carbamoyltransferase
VSFMENLISIKDLSKREIEDVFKTTTKLHGKTTNDLHGKSLAMIFEKPSTRTRISFEVAMSHLGGRSIFLSSRDMQLGRGESIADTARVLSRYVDAVMARLYKHEVMLELDKYSDIPVINGLTDSCHPCQVLADLYTILEKKGTLDLKIAWVGDGNNVCNSFVFAQEKLEFKLSIATPSGYEPKAINSVKGNKRLELTNNPKEAVKGADVVVTDSWISMGDESEKEERIKTFSPYQVNKDLVKFAKPNYLFMHCLPYKKHEVSENIIYGPNSIVFDEAENRLHVQKAILSLLIEK